ncbi:MAG: TlpA disulfide reductase family protein [Zavarzinella sp.]
MKQLIAGFVIILSSMPLMAQANARQDAMDKIIKDFVDARRAYSVAIRRATTEADEKAAAEKLPKEKDFLPRILALVKENGTDEVAAEMLTMALFAFDTKNPEVVDALDKLTTTAAIKPFVENSIGGAPVAAKPFLKKVLDKNPDKTMQGLACLALGELARGSSDPESAKEAEQYFLRIEKEFADVKGPSGTLGESVKRTLFEIKNLSVGKIAPDAESVDVSTDKPAKLSDFRGKVVVLDFWATWCGPCKQMIPHEREMVKKLKEKPFVLVSISADDGKEELTEFLKTTEMPWVHWWQKGGPLFEKWNVNSLPTIYVIDAKGVIRYKNVRGKDLEEAVEKLLAEK